MQTMTVLKAPNGLMKVEVRQAWVDVTMPFLTLAEVRKKWAGTAWENPDPKLSDQAYLFVDIFVAIEALCQAGKEEAASVWLKLSNTGWSPYIAFRREFCKIW